MSDCRSASGTWEVSRIQKRGGYEKRISHNYRRDFCETHLRMILDDYRLTENPEEVDRIHWFRFIFGNLIIGIVLGFGVAVAMIRITEMLFGPESSLARAGNRAMILYMLAGWGTAMFVGWDLRL